MLLLDSALDAALANRITAMREDGTFLGLGFATDESPPSQVRFNSLRFQITVVYLPTFPPPSTWTHMRYDQKPPLHREHFVLDTCHCPSKRGAAVMQVLGSQLGRIGATEMDILCGTGDGGGENEGSQGVHHSVEQDQPSYVRRCCSPHVAWTVCRQGLPEFDLKTVEKVCA